jgi:DNA-binding GntR family transcriptional regulator
MAIAVERAFVRPVSMHEAVLAELRRRIGSGELRPGERLLAEKIAAELGVSRVPVREALKILEGEGQVNYQGHRGAFVAELSLAELQELYRMRELLEDEATRAAVATLDDELLARIEGHLEAADAMSARSDLGAYALANRHFHFELYAAAGKSLLLRMIQQLWDASDAYRAMFANMDAHRSAASEDHRAIFDALCRRDADAVIHAQNVHRDRALDAMAYVLTR